MNGVSNELDPQATSSELDANFEHLFGISRAQLRDRGVDEHTYILEHLSDAMEKNGPASYRLRKRYNAWRARTLYSFAVLCLVVAFMGGATGPLKSDLAARMTVIIVCLLVMAVMVGGDVRARRRYRRAMKDEAIQERHRTSSTVQGEFSSMATLARGPFAFGIPVSQFAEVTVRGGVLTLWRRPKGKLLAQVELSAVKVTEPRIFLGTAVKLDLGGAGRWVVGFAQPYGLADDARSTTRHFLRALRDAHMNDDAHRPSG